MSTPPPWESHFAYPGVMDPNGKMRTEQGQNSRKLRHVCAALDADEKLGVRSSAAALAKLRSDEMGEIAATLGQLTSEYWSANASPLPFMKW